MSNKVTNLRYSLAQVCILMMSALPQIADFISRFEFSFLCFLAFSVPFSNHTLRDFKEEISNNLLRFCILFRFRELHFLRDTRVDVRIIRFDTENVFRLFFVCNAIIDI